MTASYKTRGAIAVITMHNPPVNGLGFDTDRKSTRLNSSH